MSRANSRSERTFGLPSSEAAFREYFVESGRQLKSELWIVILATTAAMLIIQAFILDVPGALVPFWPYFLIGIIVPIVLRWLSGAQSPLRRGSTFFFIASVYIDLVCLMTIRVMSIRAGLDLVPVLIPVTILLSLMVAQIRFSILAPAVLLGFTGIAVCELTLIPATSNVQFNLVACAAILLAPLTSSFELQRSTHAAWRRVQQLAESSRTDPLTRLPNRRTFDDTFDALVADPEIGPVQVAIIDLDEFKRLNDRLGHPAGDRTLTAIGRYLAGRIDSAHEFAARLSGEEFAIVWHGVDRAVARSRAEELRRGIAHLRLDSGGDEPVTASAGLAELSARSHPENDPARTRHALLFAADKALYAAKTSGRNRLAETAELVDWRSSDAPSPVAPRRATFATLEPASGLRKTLLGMRFPPDQERRFRAEFDATGLLPRRFITSAIIFVSVGILIFQGGLLDTPPEAQDLAWYFLGLGIIPGALLGLIGTFGPMRRRSAYFYIAGVAVVITAQMVLRLIQLPKGWDVVPFLMPLSVLLSLSVVQIRFPLLLPANCVVLSGMMLAELIAFPLTTDRIYLVIAGIVMVGVATRFSYRIEAARRVDWIQSEQLYLLARTDALTGLPNRRRFQERLDAALSADDGARALVFLDVDHLKRYNDTFGHLAGDVCLRQIGETLDLHRAAPDHVARIGGEEFVALLAGSPAEELERRARAMVRSVEALGIPSPAAGKFVTVSGGFTLLRPDDDTSAVIARADAALYRAKSEGRNRLSIADPFASTPAITTTLPTGPRQRGVAVSPANGESPSVPAALPIARPRPGSP